MILVPSLGSMAPCKGASCFIFGRSRDRLNILSWGYFFVNNFFRFLQKFFQNSKSP